MLPFKKGEILEKRLTQTRAGESLQEDLVVQVAESLILGMDGALFIRRSGANGHPMCLPVMVNFMC